ncbi:MAG TPA: HNH endonuclease signature motif containing protein [Sphingomicrobium sp.]
MSSLNRIVAAHPLVEEPYGRIKFSRINQHDVPVYKVGRGKREFSAENALRETYRLFGGRCFHCGETIDPSAFTLDHLRPKRDDGGDHLHNLVFACWPCNKSKAGSQLASFEAEKATRYLKALDEHLIRCIKNLNSDTRG